MSDEQEVILTGIKKGIDLLFRRRIGVIERKVHDAQEVAEVDKRKITFPVVIDYSESVPSIKIGMAWSQTVRDELISLLPDPDQPEFQFISVAESKENSAGEGGDE